MDETQDLVRRARDLLTRSVGGPPGSWIGDWQEALRAVHTLKGAAAMMQQPTIAARAHGVEDLLQAAVAGQADPEEVFDQTLREFQEILIDVHLGPVSASHEPVRAGPTTRTNPLARTDPPTTPSPRRQSVRPAPLGEILHVEAEEVARLRGCVGRLDSLRGKLAGLRRDENTGAFDALDDDLWDLQRALDGVVDRLSTVALVRVYARVSDVVEPLAHDRGRKVRFVSTGSEIRVPPETADALVAVLRALVINAADHGIEAPDVRRARGKPEEGTVAVNAREDAAQGMLALSVEDDGEGMGELWAREAARRLGDPQMAGTEALEQTQPVAVTDAASRPTGLSSRGAPDQWSGRGLGLETVGSVLRELGAHAALETLPGAGTVVAMMIPLPRSRGGRTQDGGADSAR